MTTDTSMLRGYVRCMQGLDINESRATDSFFNDMAFNYYSYEDRNMKTHDPTGLESVFA